MSVKKKIALWIGLVLFLPLLVIWLIVAQPSLSQNSPSSIQVSSEKLQDHVKMLSTTFHPRSFRNMDNLNKTADYIAEHFRKAGAMVRFQEYIVRKRTYKNVVATFGTSTKDLFVVGAHYDSYNKTPGADDNASGVAGLIELAYLIGKSELKKTNIELVAYTLEEPPFFATKQMGSYIHAKSLSDKQAQVKGMISLEMIGYFTDESHTQAYPLPALKLMYPSKGNFITVVGTMGQRPFTKSIKTAMNGTTALQAYSINAPEIVQGIDYSDHRNYWTFGYQAVMVTDTSFYRNHEYHEVNDTHDRLNYKRMAMVVIAIFEALFGGQYT